MKKHTVGITTKIDNASVYTFIDLRKNTLTIKRENVILFEGTTDEFKVRIIKHDSKFNKAVYEDILNLAEELIEVLSSK